MILTINLYLQQTETDENQQSYTEYLFFNPFPRILMQ